MYLSALCVSSAMCLQCQVLWCLRHAAAAATITAAPVALAVHSRLNTHTLRSSPPSAPSPADCSTAAQHLLTVFTNAPDMHHPVRLLLLHLPGAHARLSSCANSTTAGQLRDAELPSTGGCRRCGLCSPLHCVYLVAPAALCCSESIFGGEKN